MTGFDFIHVRSVIAKIDVIHIWANSFDAEVFEPCRLRYFGLFKRKTEGPSFTSSRAGFIIHCGCRFSGAKAANKGALTLVPMKSFLQLGEWIPACQPEAQGLVIGPIQRDL
ncbi:MAG: hypothetical protein ATN33_00320 [Epulopiscium sp. Nele67-Bin001]|nr:MAG: hypothetical protein ATN33_00320 [Epulopiscium sp. Nele67-Bin001]